MGNPALTIPLSWAELLDMVGTKACSEYLVRFESLEEAVEEEKN